MSTITSSRSANEPASVVVVTDVQQRGPSPCVQASAFCHERAMTPLRVTCYGSSSSQTPDLYLQQAYDLGYLLAKRGHTCVNGAGSFGCMAAMNDGAAAGNGHIVGVIHEMWLVDQQDWQSTAGSTGSCATNTPKQVPQLQTNRSLRDGGAHAVFGATTTKEQQPTQHGVPHSALQSVHDAGTAGRHPIREMLVAGGKDLQERKRLLVENAQALVVLPGGPGTFDELWEASCARNIGLKTALPIVCINCDGYYEPFRTMLQRAYDDKLTKLQPDEIIHFVDTAEAAVRWVEAVQEQENWGAPKVVLQQRAATLRMSSFMGGGPTFGWSSALRQSFTWLTESLRTSRVVEESDTPENPSGEVSIRSDDNSKLVWGFAAGLAAGVMLQRVMSSRTTVQRS